MFIAFLVDAIAQCLIFLYACHIRFVKIKKFVLARPKLVGHMAVLFIWLLFAKYIYHKQVIEIEVPSLLLENALQKEQLDMRQLSGIYSNSKRIVQDNITNTWVVAPGQNLGSILSSIGFVNWQMDKVLTHRDTKFLKLYPGMTIKLKYDCEIEYVSRDTDTNLSVYPMKHQENRRCFMQSMSIDLQNDIRMIATFEGKELIVINSKIGIKRMYRVISGIVNESIYGDAIASNVPSAIVVKALREYSYILDFQRDIHKGDEFTFGFEEIVDLNGKKLRNGNLTFANFVVNGNSKQLYLFKGEYYNENGETIKKSLLRTPVDGARISSGFGRRKHPVLGFTRAHQGVDFAAPTGTPIQAAGDGVIEFIGVKGGYGKFISIRHNKSMRTNYAHMNRFANGAYSGARVKQRQIIGYVGATGIATGPHLHFEVVIGNKKVNPKGIYVASGDGISKKDRAEFNHIVQNIKKIISSDA